MVCFRGRVIRPELMDHLPPGQAAANLRDLGRINHMLGGHETTRRAFSRLVQRDEAFTVLDVGAGRGDTAYVLGQAFPNARVLSADYRFTHLMSAPPALRCKHHRAVADAFAMPFRSGSFDFVFCSLFLHHFGNDTIVELLRSFAQLARRAVVVNDLDRNILPYLFLPVTKMIFKWDPVTLHDGPVSVEAGFKAAELRRLAEAAGLTRIQVVTRRPAFRISLIGEPSEPVSPEEASLS